MQVQPAPPGYVQPASVAVVGPPVVVAPATTQVVVQQNQPTAFVPQNRKEALRFFRETPVRTICPACNATVITSIHYEIGTFAFVCAGLCIVFGLWLGCCVIPFFLNLCKDVLHSCPQCGHAIGRYNRV